MCLADCSSFFFGTFISQVISSRPVVKSGFMYEKIKHNHSKKSRKMATISYLWRSFLPKHNPDYAHILSPFCFHSLSHIRSTYRWEDAFLLSHGLTARNLIPFLFLALSPRESAKEKGVCWRLGEKVSVKKYQLNWLSFYKWLLPFVSPF